MPKPCAVEFNSFAWSVPILLTSIDKSIEQNKAIKLQFVIKFNI